MTVNPHPSSWRAHSRTNTRALTSAQGTDHAPRTKGRLVAPWPPGSPPPAHTDPALPGSRGTWRPRPRQSRSLRLGLLLAPLATGSGSGLSLARAPRLGAGAEGQEGRQWLRDRAGARGGIHVGLWATLSRKQGGVEGLLTGGAAVCWSGGRRASAPLWLVGVSRTNRDATVGSQAPQPSGLSSRTAVPGPSTWGTVARLREPGLQTRAAMPREPWGANSGGADDGERQVSE